MCVLRQYTVEFLRFWEENPKLFSIERPSFTAQTEELPPKVARDHAICLAPIKLRHLRRDIAMRRTVKAISPEAVLFAPLRWDSVGSRFFRERCVKRSLKHRNQRRARQNTLKQPHRVDIGRIVQRIHDAIVFHRREHPLVNDLRARDLLCMRRLKPDRVDFFNRGDRADFLI